MAHKWLIFLLLFSVLTNLSGQSHKQLRSDEIFEAGALIGMNVAQMDGDFFTGFDKIGWYGGLRGIVNFTYRSSLYLEMLYSQKGSKIPHGVLLDSRDEVKDRIIDLHYAEVPIVFHYQLSPEEKGTFMEIGPVISRLLDTRIQERTPTQLRGTSYQEIQSDFKSTEISALVGLGIPITPKLDLNLRYHFAISRFYENENFATPIPFSRDEKEVEFLRNYYLSLFVSYQFFSASSR